MSVNLNFLEELTPEQILQLNMLVYESTLESGKISDYFKVVNNVKTGDPIYLKYFSDSMIGKRRKGNCELNEHILELKTDGKKWVICGADFRIPLCSDEIKVAYEKWAHGVGHGIEQFDLITAKEFMDFILPVLEDKINDMYMRYAWFGDSNADENEDLTCDHEFFDFCDGVFPQLETMKANGEKINYVKIEDNEFTDKAINSSVNTFDILKNVILGASNKLRSETGQRIYVSQAFLTKMELDLINQEEGCCTEKARSVQENGIRTFNYLGHTLIPVPEWDKIILTCFGNKNPFRVIYTTADNLQFGTPSRDRMENFDAFLDKKSKKFYIDGLQEMGISVVEAELVSYAL